MANLTVADVKAIQQIVNTVADEMRKELYPALGWTKKQVAAAKKAAAKLTKIQKAIATLAD